MTDFEKEEFWNALDRLYDSSLELRKSIEELRTKSEQDGKYILALARTAEIHEPKVTERPPASGTQ